MGPEISGIFFFFIFYFSERHLFYTLYMVLCILLWELRVQSTYFNQYICWFLHTIKCIYFLYTHIADNILYYTLYSIRLYILYCWYCGACTVKYQTTLYHVVQKKRSFHFISFHFIWHDRWHNTTLFYAILFILSLFYSLQSSLSQSAVTTLSQPSLLHYRYYYH